MALSNISASQSGGSARRFQREELGKLSCYGAKGWQAQLPWHQTNHSPGCNGTKMVESERT